MVRRVICGLVGALIGTVAVSLLWWLLLGLFLLLAGGPSLFSPRELGSFVSTGLGAVLTFLLSPLGLVHGALVGAARGRLDRLAVLEVLWSPFAWVVSVGDGFLGGLLLVVSLLPGASIGMLIGLLLAGAGKESRLPDEAVIGTLIGVVASLLGYNLYLVWPGLRGKPEKPAS
jgi:hypothetical protein